MAQKTHKSTVERLREREDKRKAALGVLKEKVTVSGERAALEDAFLRSFKTNCQEAESSVIELTSTTSAVVVQSTLDQVAERSQQLQKDLADNSHILSKYNLKSAQQHLQSLVTSLARRKEELAPPKKFSFSMRQKAAPDTHTDAPDGPTSTDGPSPATNIPTLPVTPLCGFADQDGQVLRMTPSEVNGVDLDFARLTNCTVYIQGYPSTVHISQLAKTQLYCGPVRSSVFIDDCKECAFSLACQQLRLHRTTHSAVSLHVTSSGIIEDCSDMHFAPYNFTYKGIEEHFKDAQLSEVNNWDKIEDFNWLSSGTPSPNWNVLPESQRILVSDTNN